MVPGNSKEFKRPGRSRRCLNEAFNQGESTMIFPKKNTGNNESFAQRSSGSRSNSMQRNMRLTRSSMKEWDERAGHKKLSPKLPASDDSGVMKPPPQPLLQVALRCNLGMMTRRKYRSLFRDSLDSHHSTKVSLYKGSSVSNTSEYGTASEESKTSIGRDNLSSSDSCYCETMSGVGSLHSDDDFGGMALDPTDECLLERCDLSAVGWDSDTSEPQLNLDHKATNWDSDAEVEYFRHLRETMQVKLLQTGQISAIIPTVNRSSYSGEFKIHLKAAEEQLYRPGLCSSMRVHHVSPVVSMEPHGVQFHESFPALLVLPLSVEPQCEAWLACLYSNTPDGQPPQWERLPSKCFSYRNGFLVITASHFSLFTVILEEPYPEVMKRIRCRTGGRLELVEVPGVQVEFPRRCLEEDLDAYLRVLFDSEPGFQPDSIGTRQRALASPVIMLGPHGHQFNTSREPVRVMLPVPNFHEIVSRFGSRARLSVWQSSTQEGEPLVWQRHNVSLSPPTVSQALSIPVVSFPVHHFSFFKLVWDVLSSSLYEAKMGMSYFYPYISFSMMCQAFMEESAGDSRFGLEVICYRSDRRLPETTNYRHRVGASLKPKLIRPGRILLHLRSQMFEADIEAGEDKDMAKEERDFRGRDFEKQYACRFKPNVTVERGTFGKVIVERLISGNKDPLFEFNLHKTGFEMEATLPVGCERWTVVALKELAESLQITEGSNWKKFAQYIGFTKSEIKSKLQYSPDPFLAMMNLYNGRGGTPEEFIQALYAVSRDLRLHNTSMTGGSNSDRDSSGRSKGSRGSGSRASSSQGSGGAKRAFWRLAPWSRAAQDSDSDFAENEKKPKKRSHNSSNKKSGGSSAPKRRKYSDVSVTISSSSSEGRDEVSNKNPLSGGESSSAEIHRNNARKLNDQDLWQISANIVRKDWRNLGRTLGIEEQILMNLEHSHQATGFRECAYQMLLEWKGRKPRKCTFGELYSALVREDMAGVAKNMVKQFETDADKRDSS